MFMFPLIAYRFSSKVSALASTVYTNSFGFEAGGGFSINVSNIGIPSILISVCNQSAYKTFFKAQSTEYDCSNLLNICSRQKILTIEDSFASYNDTIPQKGKYTTFFTVCQAKLSSYQINAEYWNPNSRLSTTVLPCVYIKPIFLGYCGILLIFWIVNWIIYRKASTIIHKYYSFSLVLAFFSILVEMIYYLHYNKSDDDIGISNASAVFDVIFEIIIFTGIVFLSQGYGIIDNDYSVWNVVKVFVGVTIIFVALRVYSILENIWAIFAILLVFGASFGFLFHQMIKGSHDAILKIHAHRIVIEQNGIDFTTTPIMKKLQILTRISWIFTGYLLIRIIIIILQVYIGVDLWIPVLIQDILNGSLLTLVVIFFRLNEQTAAGYSVIGQSTIGRQEITRVEVLQYLQQEATLERDLKPWDGMTELPPPPILVDSPTIAMVRDQEDNMDGELDDVEAPPVGTVPSNTIEPLEEENPKP